ncbi:MAG: DinB family protein [Chlorobi bacterium]|nr:MAG: DinB family protein [Bacteroidota bacterium]KXK34720.1 MAG: DinB family protein [Chlorobi bacterium OLB6]MBE2266357.1 DinB family protein [Flavobacteriales bacterium]MBL1162125.1 DinB family protein [Chlorobiota bacterium]MBW7853514.1 DinB family protein [Candidatus Kapabacteria bacterium]MCC6331563.1 DinB family protein [Ignavibacteria bacterium]
MSVIETLISEIEYEAVGTVKILEGIPEDKFDWKPHAKSMSVYGLARHIARLAAWPGVIASTDSLDLAAGGSASQEDRTKADIISEFNKGTEKSIVSLKSSTAEQLANSSWTLRSGDHVIFTLPKLSVIRSMGMNHVYHHRAQLGVYLRLLDVPVPGLYGPSADERA